jgi:hypothetical protein
MTEEEWLACRGPLKMLAELRQRASARKLRLFVAAGLCCRCRIDERIRRRVEKVVLKVEQMADGTYKRKRGEGSWIQLDEDAYGAATNTARLITGRREDRMIPRREQAALLRDIFGNPFRPVTLNPAWLTSDVLALARGIYDDRAFDRMPILADALQDAGCDNDDVLTHCRDAALAHVRGCWVVDLVLGKS